MPLNSTHIFVCSNIHDISTLLQNDNYSEPFVKYNQVILDSDISKMLAARIKAAVRVCIPNLYSVLYKNKNGEKIKERDIEKIMQVNIDNLVRKIEKKYVDNYKYFIEICKDNDIKPVLMTQASMFDIESERLLNFFKQFRGRTDLSYQDGGRIFHRINNLIRNIAEEFDVLLIDLERLIPLEERYIYDLAHYTDEGCKLAADVIYSYKDKLFD